MARTNSKPTKNAKAPNGAKAARGNGKGTKAVKGNGKGNGKLANGKLAGGKLAGGTRTNGAAARNGYHPSEREPFMNPKMRDYFRQKLLGWKSELAQESSDTIQHLQESSLSEPDLADRASLETDRSLELRTRDRERKLIAKIDGALRRIDDGSYGYCEETEEPISLRRLEARPVATLSLEAQERHERLERTHRDG